MNILTKIATHAKKNPLQKALIVPKRRGFFKKKEKSITFSQLIEETKNLSEQLKLAGLEEKDRVLLFVRPSLYFPVIVLSLLKLKVIPIFIDPGMKKKFLFKAIKEASPKGLIAEAEIHWLALFFPKVFATCKIRMTTSSFSFSKNVLKLPTLLKKKLVHKELDTSCSQAEDTAAIIFTSGGTGIPKGVEYTQKMLTQQAEILAQNFAIDQKERDLSGFPPFSLLANSLGVTSVIAPLNPSRPAKVKPKVLLETLEDYKISFASGSPAIWYKLAYYCLEKKKTLPQLKSLLMFGAPVQTKMHHLYKNIMPNGETYTPYGATECLPMSSISGSEIRNQTANKTKEGSGTCLGKALSGTQIKIIEENANYKDLSRTLVEKKPFEIGEIAVCAAQMSSRYFLNAKANQESKIKNREDGSLWHRMGDMGYKDDDDRLWFCGRKAHHFIIKNKKFFSIPYEMVFNEHPDIKRCALIKITCISSKDEKASLVIERIDQKTFLGREKKLTFRKELETLAAKFCHEEQVKDFYLYNNFPVDTRHNIKIDRLKLQDIFQNKQSRAL